MKELVVGIDVGGTRTKIGLVDLELGKVAEVLVYATETKSSTVFFKQIAEAISQFKDKSSNDGYPIKGIGIGVPSFVYEDGIVDSTYGSLPFMEDYPFKQLIENTHQIPCKIDNDARVIALGEANYGEGKEFDRVLVLTLGTGLGIGFTVNGKLVDSTPYAHMAGHLSVSANGIKCYCGRIGCLEELVSASGICRAAEVLGWENRFPNLPLTAENIFKANKDGHPMAVLLVADLIANLKIGIANYINIYAPDVIVLGGGVAKGLTDYMAELYDPNLLYPYKNYKVVIKNSMLQEHAGVIGSAALFSNQKVRSS
ncbi:ROK family protein [Pedobacter frigiditerrae]|uniref:ROK family protein n=1 Tax=Pedobacter frigiditerrae TaxID=2530452 RepID=A0A4R0MPH9_9SPHI|nr:ROK family protein [Pedobacter frigiditerrae]TCC88741.1 ROK family protein [Pedobacter frigiditerrae]